MRRILFVCQFLFLFSFFGFSQDSYRFKADIIMKVKNSDSSYQYTRGSVFYDRNFKKIIYKTTFPQKELYVSIDTLVYRYAENKLISTVSNVLKPEYSIYQFILNNDIADFGLKKSGFVVASVERAGDQILTKWIPPQGNSSMFGTILISSKNKRLNSVLIHNSKKVLVYRQIYKNYQSIKGVEIPTEILSITYIGDLKQYQIIEFRNVLINEPGNDADYNFIILKK
jgi:hypothetical protein